MLAARGAFAPRGTVSSWTTEMLSQTGIGVVNLTPTIAELATTFPADYPCDPADRIIGATARAEGIKLVTSDERIARSPLVSTVW